MMDLTVEIDGDIETLEEALGQFTAPEILDKDNKYNCGRFVTFPSMSHLFKSFLLFFIMLLCLVFFYYSLLL